MLSSIRQLLSRFARVISVLLFVGLVGCSTGGKDHTQEEPTPDETSADQDDVPSDGGPQEDTGNSAASSAVVEAVDVSGEAGSYNFSVTLRSPDTGCEQYADWWEVSSPDGETLHYRRILAHSHVNEQPFTHWGGPVEIQGDEEVVVRAHMNPGGYGTGEVAMKGTPETGFSPFAIPDGWGTELESEALSPMAAHFEVAGVKELRSRLLEALGLKALDRAGWVRRGVTDVESVAAHSWGVAWLVLALCPAELDRGRALALAVIHDLPEVRAGDITPHDGVDEEDKLAEERRALAALVAPLERAEELQVLWEEYAAGETAEARFVKACDKLDMGLQARWYEREQPVLDLEEFVDSALSKLGESQLAALLGTRKDKPLTSDD